MTFQAWIKSQGLTTQELAENLGLSYWTIASWRQSKSKPDSDSAAKLREKYPDCPILEEK